MKVKEFLDHYNMGSNAKVIVYETLTNKEYRLFSDQLRYFNYYKYINNKKIDIGIYKIHSFTIRDNELTIYV